MTEIRYFQVSAFTDKLFAGNPAAVCLLETMYKTEVLEQIASENTLETVFILNKGLNYEIRWFTHKTEIDFSGHATLAAAHVIFNELKHKFNDLTFKKKDGSVVRVSKRGDLLTLDMPVQPLEEIRMPPVLITALGIMPIKVFSSGNDLMAVLETETEVLEVKPNFKLLGNIMINGVIVTAPGIGCDFVSRYFFPTISINEDPVSGSPHIMLTQYWAGKLGRNELFARQLSERGGKLLCRYKGSRVEVCGKAVTYLSGKIALTI